MVLDVLLARGPHVEAAARLFALVDHGVLAGSLCATTVTTVHYLATKACGPARAREHLRQLLELFDVAAVDGAVLADALSSGQVDFEDAVVAAAAQAAGAAVIVTRDRAGFRGAAIPALAPEELLAMVAARGDLRGGTD